jgi:hypothetical protein
MLEALWKRNSLYAFCGWKVNVSLIAATSAVLTYSMLLNFPAAVILGRLDLSRTSDF